MYKKYIGHTQGKTYKVAETLRISKNGNLFCQLCEESIVGFSHVDTVTRPCVTINALPSATISSNKWRNHCKL